MNDRYSDGTALCCSKRCATVYAALLAPPFCAIPDCNATVYIDIDLKIVRDYCCIDHARLDASRGAFTFACDRPDAAHGESSCTLATCPKKPTSGSEFCCITHVFEVVPSVAPAPLPTMSVPRSDPLARWPLLDNGPHGEGADAETAAATVAAVAAAAAESMASPHTSLAEIQAELEAHRSEYADLLRRQAGTSPPPSPPQSCPSTPEYFSSTEPARPPPPPPPRRLVSENTRSATATAAASAHAVAAAATAAAVTAAATNTLHATAHPAFTVAATAAAVTTAATAAPLATARPAVAAAATVATVTAAAAANGSPAATSAHATVAATAATHATDLPAVAAVATATAVTAATVANGRPKRLYPGVVYIAKEKAMKVMFLLAKITYIKREAPSSHTRAMSAKRRPGLPPPPPPSAPPSPASSPEPSRPLTLQRLLIFHRRPPRPPGFTSASPPFQGRLLLRPTPPPSGGRLRTGFATTCALGLRS